MSLGLHLVDLGCGRCQLFVKLAPLGVNVLLHFGECVQLDEIAFQHFLASCVCVCVGCDVHASMSVMSVMRVRMNSKWN